MAETVLRDGRRLEVRPADVGDVDAVIEFYGRLTPQDRYRRFFSGGLPSRDWIERWVVMGRGGGATLVAVVVDDDGVSHVVGEAGYGPPADGAAELGIAVAPDWRGWLGPYLLDALVTTARDAGITVLEADVLSENRPMLRLLAARGDVMLPLEDFRNVRVAIPTSGRDPVWPPAYAHPRAVVEVSGGRWRGAHRAEAAGVATVACPRRPDRCPALRGEPCPLVAGADLVIVVPRADRAADDALLAAHRAVHPGCPVVVDDGRVAIEALLGPVTATTT